MKQRSLSFEELVAPISRNKAVLILEGIDLIGCDLPKIRDEIGALLNLEFSPDYDEWEDFLDNGFILLEGDLSPETIEWCEKAVELFQANEEYNLLMQISFFVDGTLKNNTWKTDLDIDRNIPSKPFKTIVIPFPVERTNRNPANT